MVYTPAAVVTYGYPIDDFTFPYPMTGNPVVGQDEGKALAWDFSGSKVAVKLAGDGDVIIGRVTVIEVRADIGMTVATVQRRFKEKLPAPVGHTITLGQTVVGSATAGLVKANASQAEPKANHVVEVGTDYVVVERL